MKFIQITTTEGWGALIRIEDIDWISKDAIWMKPGSWETSLQMAGINEDEFDRISEVLKTMGRAI